MASPCIETSGFVQMLQSSWSLGGRPCYTLDIRTYLFRKISHLEAVFTSSLSRSQRMTKGSKWVTKSETK
jgi:hypothetical protein